MIIITTATIIASISSTTIVAAAASGDATISKIIYSTSNLYINFSMSYWN